MNKDSLILTDSHTNKFIAVINKTPKDFVKSLDKNNPKTKLNEWIAAIEILSRLVPKINEIDINNAFSIDLDAEAVPNHHKPSEWTITIWGDDGIVVLKLTKKFAIWS
tara:strand:+ start:106 stop:429 length:324 start_codon:yes stop_codon:yes gene_type:complete